jgi:pimeloyl-ACP methyl ester carboxylesterase
MNTIAAGEVHYLNRPEGRVSYTVEGSGPLVIAVPGMGDLRSSYREITGPLVAAGYRVAVTDLRGHGQSDITFREQGDIATARDVIALIDELGGPALVLGNSMGAAAAAWAAAERPDAIAGLVLYGPLLRDPTSNAFVTASMHGMYRVLLAAPWGASFWSGYYGKMLNKGRRAPWVDRHVADIKSALREPGRLRSFRHLALKLTHSVVEPRLGEVRAPILAFVGELDPDFRDPAAERDWIASLGAEAVLVAESGHYPHAQRPDITVPATIGFADALRSASADGEANPVAAAWAAHA